MNKNLTVIVLTYNEELHLARCLESVRTLASEIVVVDSFSTDKTQEIARTFGAKVTTHEFKNQADQFNWALDNVSLAGEWVLRLDADEYLLPELAEEIKRGLAMSDHRKTMGLSMTKILSASISVAASFLWGAGLSTAGIIRRSSCACSGMGRVARK